MTEELTDLLAPALVAIENEGVHIVFPEEPTPHGARLLETLGVTWSVDPHAPRLDGSLSADEREERKRANLAGRRRRYEIRRKLGLVR